MPPGFARPVFRSARITVALLPGVSALLASRVEPWSIEARGRREQRGWTRARARGGPHGPDTSPRRREAARREQAKRDHLPLMTAVTGGPVPVVPGGSGVVPPAAHTARPFHPMGLSLCGASRALLRLCLFDRGSISPGRRNVKWLRIPVQPQGWGRSTSQRRSVASRQVPALAGRPGETGESGVRQGVKISLGIALSLP